MIEPIHTIGPRTTADSKAEGRMKIGIGSPKKRKRKILKRVLNNKY